MRMFWKLSTVEINLKTEWYRQQQLFVSESGLAETLSWCEMYYPIMIRSGLNHLASVSEDRCNHTMVLSALRSNEKPPIQNPIIYISSKTWKLHPWFTRWGRFTCGNLLMHLGFLERVTLTLSNLTYICRILQSQHDNIQSVSWWAMLSEMIRYKIDSIY